MSTQRFDRITASLAGAIDAWYNATRDGDTAMFRHRDEDASALATLQAELGGKVAALRVRRPNLNDVFLWVNTAQS